MKNLQLIISGILVVAILGALPGIYFYTEGNAGTTDGIQRIDPSFGVVDSEAVRMPRNNELAQTNATLERLSAEQIEEVRHRLKVDLNNADAAALERISGVGPATARNIISYRERHGAFRSIDELTNVSGIGPRTVENMRAQIKIEGQAVSQTRRTETTRREPEPATGAGDKININSASENELTGITGVGPATARNIVQYREQQGLISDSNDLQNVSGIGPATVARMENEITF